MAIRIKDRGNANTCLFKGDEEPDGDSGLLLNGNDNTIEFGNDVHLYGSRIGIFGNGNRIRIDSGTRLHLNLQIRTDEATFEVGEGTTIMGLEADIDEPLTIRIGAECMFSSEIWATVSDVHSIIDRTSGERVNPGRDIIIGDRVWVGRRAVLLKGSSVGDGSIIGSASVVTGNIPKHCSAAGNPARVIRQEVEWVRPLK